MPEPSAIGHKKGEQTDAPHEPDAGGGGEGLANGFRRRTEPLCWAKSVYVRTFLLRMLPVLYGWLFGVIVYRQITAMLLCFFAFGSPFRR